MSNGVAVARSTRPARQVEVTLLDLPRALAPRGGGLTLLETSQGVLAVLFGRHSLRALPDWPRLARLGADLRLRPKPSAAANALQRYVDGALRRFTSALDLSLATPFERQVFRRLQQVPFGSVTTYADLAREVGKPKASRAVGGAMQRNPLPLFVPCHRVVASDGTLGGFSGGLELKRRLLELEGIAKRPGGWAPSRRPQLVQS